MEGGKTAYAEVDRKWKATIRLLLGVEPGELCEYGRWLYDPPVRRKERRSGISGKPVVYAEPNYGEDGKWAGLAEIDFGKKYEGANFGGCKTLASLVESARDRLTYTGNIILGNSGFVQESSNIIDSFYIYHSEKIAHGKHMAYCSVGSQGSECVFGSHGFGKISFQIKAKSVMNSTRCLELHKSQNCSDCYYSHGLENCQECIFCFNLRNRKYCVGNRELPKEEYFRVKKRVLGEFGKILLKEKRLPKLTEMFRGINPDTQEARSLVAGKAPPKKPEDKSRIERAFSETSRIIFGKDYKGIDNYKNWLLRFTAGRREGRGCLSGQRLIVPEHINFWEFPPGRLVLQWEADLLGEGLRISEEEAMGISLANAPQILSRIAFFCVEWEMGNTANNIESQLNLGSTDCYRGILNTYSKLCGYNYWPRDSEYLFGCNEGRSSSFCMKCFHSENLTRCFEVDTSKNCSDCYFCHNCENVRDGILCFNVKNLRYAVGNLEVGREKYMQIKKMLLGELNNELEKTGGINRGIFRLF